MYALLEALCRVVDNADVHRCVAAAEDVAEQDHQEDRDQQREDKRGTVAEAAPDGGLDEREQPFHSRRARPVIARNTSSRVPRSTLQVGHAVAAASTVGMQQLREDDLGRARDHAHGDAVEVG